MILEAGVKLMNPHTSLDKCLSFINCQLEPKAPVTLQGQPLHYRTVTISRQSGAGGHEVAEHLAEFLQAKAPNESRRWTVFDKNLVEKVLEDHHLPKRFAQFMPEDKVSDISDAMDELFGLHPSSWSLVEHTAETILRLANLGNAIIIGRGANVITASLDHVFHVRLVSALEKRTEYLENLLSINHAAALEMIHHEERGRERYLQKNYGANVNDPLLYHLIINTGLLGYEQAAQLIGEAMLQSAAQGTTASGPAATKPAPKKPEPAAH
jgi:hypothetical protein